MPAGFVEPMPFSSPAAWTAEQMSAMAGDMCVCARVRARFLVFAGGFTVVLNLVAGIWQLEPLQLPNSCMLSNSTCNSIVAHQQHDKRPLSVRKDGIMKFLWWSTFLRADVAFYVFFQNTQKEQAQKKAGFDVLAYAGRQAAVWWFMLLQPPQGHNMAGKQPKTMMTIRLEVPKKS